MQELPPTHTLYVGPTNPPCCASKIARPPTHPRTSLQNEPSTRPPCWRKRYYARQHTPMIAARSRSSATTDPSTVLPTNPCTDGACVQVAFRNRPCGPVTSLSRVCSLGRHRRADYRVCSRGNCRRGSSREGRQSPQRQCHGELLALMHGPCISMRPCTMCCSLSTASPALHCSGTVAAADVMCPRSDKPSLSLAAPKSCGAVARLNHPFPIPAPTHGSCAAWPPPRDLEPTDALMGSNRQQGGGVCAGSARTA